MFVVAHDQIWKRTIIRIPSGTKPKKPISAIINCLIAVTSVVLTCGFFRISFGVSTILLNRLTLSLSLISLASSFLICWRKKTIPSVFDPFSKTNRLESGCVFGMLALEILHSFERIVLLNKDKGPLLDLFQQIMDLILIGGRYLPILISIETHHFVSYGITAAVVWMEIFSKIRMVRHFPFYFQAIFLAIRLTLLFIGGLFKQVFKKVTFWRYLTDKPTRDFQFSKQMFNLYVISFNLIFYFTFWILKYSQSGDNFAIKATASVSGIVCGIQLILGMRKYRRHILNAYRGNFEDIPRRERFGTHRILTNAFHFPGFMIGHLIWGYLVLVGVSFNIYLGLRSVFRLVSVVHLILRWILPAVTLYTLKLVFIRIWVISLTRNGLSSTFVFFFNYLNFFFDCFIGIIICVSRIGQTAIASLILLPRIDHCIFGRHFETFDKGYASYVCWIHLEAIQTNPTIAVFCEEIKERIISRRIKRSDLMDEADWSSKVEADLKRYERRKQIRFKFALLVTLLRNPGLVKMRKQKRSSPPWLYKRDYSLDDKYETIGY